MQPLTPRPSARIRLFCFPYAGGGMSAYTSWRNALPETTDLWGVQMPGREDRLFDRPVTRLGDALNLLIPAVLPCLDRPFAFFGHSMGAIISFELARALQRLNCPVPRHVFVSACWPLHLLEQRGSELHKLPDDDLREELRRMEGTPPEVLASPELMALLLPVFRADLELVETYRYRPGTTLHCPVSAFGGVDDHEVSPENLAAWRELTSGPFAMHTFPGGHFYINHHRDAILRTVSRSLLEPGHGKAV